MIRNAIKPRQCAVTGEWVAENAGEYVSVWEENDYFVSAAAIEAHDGPGKFEGEVPLALVLHALALEGMADFSLCDDWQGSVDRFGRHLLIVDGQGFVKARSYRDKDEAQNAIHEAENDGFGASEDDAWISFEPRGVSVSFGGKDLGTFETLRRAKAAVSVAMRREGYYPNVFLTGEHGPSVRRIDVW